jgi:hypothetical protein
MLTDGKRASEADDYWYRRSAPTSSPGFIGDKLKYWTKGHPFGYTLLNIENRLLDKPMSKETFFDEVIDIFAGKTRRIDIQYKS